MIVLGGRVELGAKRGDLGVVDVVPLDTRTGLQPEEPTVQTAAHMQHDGLRMRGQELVGPFVEVCGRGWSPTAPGAG